jgi:putative endonuclease
MKRHASYCVYIVECTDGTYYTGYTSDLEKRITTHNKGQGAKYLRGKGPVRLVFCKKYRYYKRAVDMEREIKALTRTQKEKLVKSYNREDLCRE